jgi:hypothetical protein
MLNGSLQDSVLCGLVWNDALAPRLIERVVAEDFDTQTYRRIAQVAIDFYKQRNRPPRTHITDLLEADLKCGSDGRFMADILREMEERLKDDLAEDYVLSELDEFIARQRLGHALDQASDMLHADNRAEAIAALRPHIPPIEPPAPAQERPWPKLDDGALYGLAGEIVRTIAPHTEADPAALLFQFLTSFGNLVGRRPYWQIEADRHRAILYIVEVGPSAKGRKGIGWGRVRSLYTGRNDHWLRECLFSGALSTGEGIIHRLRDAREDEHKNEKRLCVMTSEFGMQLRLQERAGSTVAGMLREAWDGPEILHSPMIKSDRERATGAHISVIAHITPEDLQRYLTMTDIANGFANRFIFVCVRRSQFLPDGGQLEHGEIDRLGREIDHAARMASTFDEIKLDPQARELYHHCYDVISAEKPGLLGAVTGRAEAQVRRLAMIYTLLDGKRTTTEAHMEAGMSAWLYGEASAEYVFGDATGDPVADAILKALREAGENGLSRWKINEVFCGNKSRERINKALNTLEELRRIERLDGKNGHKGRPSETWRAVAR